MYLEEEKYTMTYWLADNRNSIGYTGIIHELQIRLHHRFANTNTLNLWGHDEGVETNSPPPGLVAQGRTFGRL